MWDNRYIISGGMYGGARCPARDLQILVNEMENHVTNAVSIRMEGDSYSLEPDYWQWGRAYGLNFSVLRTYIENHMDNTPHEFELCELEIKNPTGAQFYKQSLVFWCSITAAEMTEGAGETDPLKYCYSTISITKVCRREYPTPYRAYVDTDLGVLQGGKIANIYRSGIKSYGGFWTRLLLDCYMPLGTFTYDDKDYFAFAIYMEDERADSYDYGTSFMMLGIDLATLTTEFGGEFEPEEQTDPNEEEPPEDGPGGGGSGGGEGDHILPDEPVPIPPVPEIGAASVSWLKLFKMSTNQLNDFGEAMMPKTAWQLLQIYFTNPLDAIIGVLLIPVDAPTSGARTPALGDFTWPSAYPIINNEFYELDCGAVHIPPYWDSAFDFSPFSRFQIFLPFIGYRDIDADEIMGAGVHIKYHIDLCTGDCTAFIARSAAPEDEYGPRALQVIAQYNGNCAVRVPTGRISHDNAVTASMSLLGSAMNVGGAIMGAALGNPSNISASQVANQVSGGTMTAVNGFKKELQRSGNIAAAAGYMGVLRPYIIRQVPRQDLPKEYKRLEGYPANKGGTLAQFAGTGLNTVEAMELNGFDGFESEREELLSILRGGVIV